MVKSPQDTDIPLAYAPSVIVPSNVKRAAKFDCDEDTRLLSPGKRPKLVLASESNPEISEKITKVTESPINFDSVKDEAVSDNKVCVCNAGQSGSNEQMQQKDIKLEQECTDNKTKFKDNALKNMRDQVTSSQSRAVSRDKTRHLQTVASPNFGGKKDDEQHEPSQTKGYEHNDPSIMFSDDEEEGGAGDSQTSRERMLSSQMNRQIDRVQLFLKLERLRRPKK